MLHIWEDMGISLALSSYCSELSLRHKGPREALRILLPLPVPSGAACFPRLFSTLSPVSEKRGLGYLDICIYIYFKSSFLFFFLKILYAMNKSYRLAIIMCCLFFGSNLGLGKKKRFGKNKNLKDQFQYQILSFKNNIK